MLDVINLSKKVVSKEEFEKVIDRKFSTFTSEYINNPTERSELTVEEFFIEYDKLFFEIPVNGLINSHEYLIKRSSELVNLDTRTVEIDLLIQEIDLLRSELLSAYRKLEELQA